MRAGKTSRDRGEGTRAALLQLAAEQRFGERGAAEVAHLGDATTTRVALTPRKLFARRAKVEGMLSALTAGRYPARPDRATCARCPHLVGCGRLPAGSIDLVRGE